MHTTKFELVTTLLELYPNITIGELQNHMNRISENHFFITREVSMILGHLEITTREIKCSRNKKHQIVYRLK